MRYADFEKLIYDRVESASEFARRAFALDTIRLLHHSSRGAIQEDLTEAERLMLDEIMTGLENTTPQFLKAKVRDLNDSQCQDSIRAIEFNPKVTQLVCAMDHWADFRNASNPAHVAHIAINMVVAIDYDLDGDNTAYSIENMFAAPEMAGENDRQKRMLVAGK